MNGPGPRTRHLCEIPADHACPDILHSCPHVDTGRVPAYFLNPNTWGLVRYLHEYRNCDILVQPLMERAPMLLRGIEMDGWVFPVMPIVCSFETGERPDG